MSKHNSKDVIPEVVKKEIENIYIYLSSDELLSRCLEGTNQNANKAFNQILRRKCPKNTFVSKDVLEMGTFSSVVSFNSGFLALANVLKNLHLTPGNYFVNRALVFDSKRVKNVPKKSTGTVKYKRKKLRAIRKGFIDKEKYQEGAESYSKGSFFYFISLVFSVCDISDLKHTYLSFYKLFFNEIFRVCSSVFKLVCEPEPNSSLSILGNMGWFLLNFTPFLISPNTLSCHYGSKKNCKFLLVHILILYISCMQTKFHAKRMYR